MSRQKLLDEYSRLKENWNNADNAVDKCISLLKDLPPVTPKRKTGKWIKDDFTGIIQCDQCGNDSPMDTTGGGQYESNFCQNCGAKMEGERDG